MTRLQLNAAARSCDENVERQHRGGNIDVASRWATLAMYYRDRLREMDADVQVFQH